MKIAIVKCQQLSPEDAARLAVGYLRKKDPAEKVILEGEALHIATTAMRATEHGAHVVKVETMRKRGRDLLSIHLHLKGTPAAGASSNSDPPQSMFTMLLNPPTAPAMGRAEAEKYIVLTRRKARTYERDIGSFLAPCKRVAFVSGASIQVHDEDDESRTYIVRGSSLAISRALKYSAMLLGPRVVPHEGYEEDENTTVMEISEELHKRLERKLGMLRLETQKANCLLVLSNKDEKCYLLIFGKPQDRARIMSKVYILSPDFYNDKLLVWGPPEESWGAEKYVFCADPLPSRTLKHISRLSGALIEKTNSWALIIGPTRNRVMALELLQAKEDTLVIPEEFAYLLAPPAPAAGGASHQILRKDTKSPLLRQLAMAQLQIRSLQGAPEPKPSVLAKENRKLKEELRLALLEADALRTASVTYESPPEQRR